ncbi:hypothetical protein BU17DRAFT_71659 [Hysterangium stoloniferum]|nr:hypothetical protein BU17DRAFT_71659 [Hysterangium stoloniferum]
MVSSGYSPFNVCHRQGGRPFLEESSHPQMPKWWSPFNFPPPAARVPSLAPVPMEVVDPMTMDTDVRIEGEKSDPLVHPPLAPTPIFPEGTISHWKGHEEFSMMKEQDLEEFFVYLLKFLCQQAKKRAGAVSDGGEPELETRAAVYVVQVSAVPCRGKVQEKVLYQR